MLADPVIFSPYGFTGDNRTVFGLEIQFFEQVSVELLHFLRPGFVIGIGFSLVEDDALDDSVFLGLLGQRDQALQRFAAITVNLVALPVGQVLAYPRVGELRMEHVDGTTVNGNQECSHLFVLGKILQHCASEVVGRTEFRPLAGEWGNCLAPLAHGMRIAITGRQVQETFAHDGVLGSQWSLTYHVRLSDGKIDVEIGVLRIAQKDSTTEC